MRPGSIQLHLLILLWVAAHGLRICGNYCGPDWCNGMALPEQLCDTTVPPDSSVFIADMCCRQHDACCGHGDRRTCNAALIKCLQAPSAATYSIICGDNGILIAEFFKLLNIGAYILDNSTMCCSDLC